MLYHILQSLEKEDFDNVVKVLTDAIKRKQDKAGDENYAGAGNDDYSIKTVRECIGEIKSAHKPAFIRTPLETMKLTTKMLTHCEFILT